MHADSTPTEVRELAENLELAENQDAENQDHYDKFYQPKKLS